MKSISIFYSLGDVKIRITITTRDKILFEIRKAGMKGGAKAEREEWSKGVREEGRKEGRKEGREEGRKGGRKGGRKEGKEEGRKGREEERDDEF